MTDHELSFEAELVKCRCGGETPTRTTDEARCICGWKCWARTRMEMEHAYQDHLRYTEEQQQKLLISPPPLGESTAASRHRLRWYNEGCQNLTGHCSWCNWQLSGLPRQLIEQSFPAHIENSRT